jgi:hypothetical protein
MESERKRPCLEMKPAQVLVV